MYSREDKLRAVELLIKYDFSPQSVIDELGYPCRGSLYNWYEEYLANDSDIPDINPYRHYSESLKRVAVDYCFEHGKCLARTRRALGYPSKELLAAWIDELEPGRRKVNRTHRGFDAGDGGAPSSAWSREGNPPSPSPMAPRIRARHPLRLAAEAPRSWAPSKMPRKKRDMAIEEPGRMRAAPGAGIDKLEPRRAVLEGMVELLGKGQGADPGMPADREKTIPVESLGPAHKLRDLLEVVGSAKASHRYQVRALAKADKYAGLRIRICEIFRDSCGRYGHRRARSVSRAEGATVSERVVCRIMAEEDLKACRPKRRRYSSYEGEISAAPENPVDRDLRADAPDEIRLAGIAGLSIPAGKVRSSPIIDCLDGKVAAGAMSTSPNAGPVNAVPGDAAATLTDGEPPVGRNDRGRRYRWPGWVEGCERCGITRSMSRKGCSPDNSAMEGLFGRLKAESFYGRDRKGWSTGRFMEALDDYIEWCNERRIKVSLGGLSPVQYRMSLGLAA